jgi:hypothetical protein
MKTGCFLLADNRRYARRRWGKLLTKADIAALMTLTRTYKFSVATGDLQFLSGSWYVTYTGLIGLARRSRCVGIHVSAVPRFCDPAASRWAFKAIVFRTQSCKGFTGFGDADPSNVSLLVHGAEMRVAETRAVNRALRKAYGIGICSVEEIGSLTGSPATRREPKTEIKKVPPQPVNGNVDNGNGSRVRDRLCQLIRQHELDANLVKSYAVDFCGTKALRDATREQVENFVVHLGDWAERDRNALLCQLNSYVRSEAGAA